MPTRYMSEALAQAERLIKQAPTLTVEERREIAARLERDMIDLRVQYEDARRTLVNALQAVQDSCPHPTVQRMVCQVCLAHE